MGFKITFEVVKVKISVTGNKDFLRGTRRWFSFSLIRISKGKVQREGDRNLIEMPTSKQSKYPNYQTKIIVITRIENKLEKGWG